MAMPITKSLEYFPVISSENDGNSNESSRHDESPPSLKNRLAEIPQEVLIEIMKWISLSEGAETSVLSLGCTARQFSAALKEFGANSWVRENTLSGNLHNQATDWIHWHLNSFGHRPGALDINSLDELKNALASVAVMTHSIKTETCSFPLLVGEKFAGICRGDGLRAFQTFQGRTLSMTTFGQNFSLELILQIEKALPSEAAMHVIVWKFIMPLNDVELARFITKLCAGKRPVSFEFSRVDFDKCPLAQKALTDALCGQGFIMELFLTDGGCNDHLLKALPTFCDRLRHVQLISIEDLKDIDDDVIEGLAEALERRRANAGSHVSITLSGDFNDKAEFKDNFFASNEKIACFEKIGLYFGKLRWTMKGDCFVQKVSSSTGHGPVDLVRSKWRPTAVEVDSDDDPIIESSEDELSSDESEDEIPVRPQRKLARPSQVEPTSEPKVKKRDKCVIS